MDYKIIERNEIKLVGMMEKIVMPNNTIPKLWEEFNKRFIEIKNVVGEIACYGVADNMSTEVYSFDETVAKEVSSFKDIPEGMITKIIPARKYLVFTHKGLIVGKNGEMNLNKTYEDIYSKIIPSLDFEVDSSFNFELYDERFSHDSDESEFDIYVPIK